MCLSGICASVWREYRIGPQDKLSCDLDTSCNITIPIHWQNCSKQNPPSIHFTFQLVENKHANGITLIQSIPKSILFPHFLFHGFLTRRPASLLCKFIRKRRSRPFSLESTNSRPKTLPKSTLSLQPPQCQSGPPGPRRR